MRKGLKALETVIADHRSRLLDESIAKRADPA